MFWGQTNVGFPPNYGIARRYISKNYPYFVTTPPAAMPIELADLKLYLRLDPDNDLEDGYLTTVIAAVTNYAESYCNRSFITRTYTTYRDGFSSTVFQLEASPFQSITSFQYLKDGVYTAVDPTLYYTILRDDYSSISLTPQSQWPDMSQADQREQSIKIVFKAGYGDAATNVPDDLKQGLMQHAAALYQNRGDDSNINTGKEAIPAAARTIYNLYRIIRLSTEAY